MTAPKQRCMVRPVHLPDPVDGLLYTGLTFRLAGPIETKRTQYQNDRVFSWHFNSPGVGSRDTFVSDWEKLTERLETLSATYTYVGTTDIVDFFPRVYLHRLENSLSDLSKDPLGTRALMRFVESWSRYFLRYPGVQFMEEVLHRDDPVADLRSQIMDVVLEEEGPYAEVDYESLTPEQKAAIDALDARSTLEGALERDLVDLRAVKFILTFLSAFRRPDLVDLVLDNLPCEQISDRSLLLDAKSALDDRRDWEQRAILYACARLPKDEFEALIAQAGGHGGAWGMTDCLKKAVLAYSKAENTFTLS